MCWWGSEGQTIEFSSACVESRSRVTKHELNAKDGVLASFFAESLALKSGAAQPLSLSGVHCRSAFQSHSHERARAGSTSQLKTPLDAELGAAQLAVTCCGQGRWCARPHASRPRFPTSLMLCSHPSRACQGQKATYSRKFDLDVRIVSAGNMRLVTAHASHIARLGWHLLGSYPSDSIR